MRRTEGCVTRACEHGVMQTFSCQDCVDRMAALASSPVQVGSLPSDNSLATNAKVLLQVLDADCDYEERENTLRKLLNVMASSPVRAGEGQREESETAWLVELGQLCVGIGTCRKKLRWVTFTDSDALRFSRKRDAENFRLAMIHDFATGEDLKATTVSEHRWYSGRAALAASTDSERDKE
jgi:hypothetical protein